MWHNFRSPFDRLRANGSAFWGSSSPAVHPSTGSGQTEAHLGDRLPWQFTLRQAQGERITHFGDRLPRLFTLRQAQGERKRTLGIVFPGCSPFDRLRANGTHFGDRLPRLFTLRQAQGERKRIFGDRLPRLFTLRQAQGERILGIVFPGCSPFDRLRGLRCQRQSAYTLRRVARELSQTSPESPLRHRAEALCGIA